MYLVKRQRTWFKRNKSIHWDKTQSEAVELVTTLYVNLNVFDTINIWLNNCLGLKLE